MKTLWFVVACLLCVVFECCRVYYIMPLPGSQTQNSLPFAYVLNHDAGVFRITLFAALLYTAMVRFTASETSGKVLVLMGILIVAAMAYTTNVMMDAGHMFPEMKQKVMAKVQDNTIDSGTLVIGVDHNGEARAYPIPLIGYHHRVTDTVGGLPVLVTYCTVCHTGRVYQPVVTGKPATFSLVGMDHFNALFEDAASGTWWQQATGEAVAGELKGSQLSEVPCEQMTLKCWIALHPDTRILQPDNHFNKQYEALKGYDQGYGGSLTGTDTMSWQAKSLVVGVLAGNQAKAYDWNLLKTRHAIHDTIGNVPVLLVLEPDSRSFRVYEENTGTILPAYQEFWHSWENFHPNTMQYSH